MQSLNCNANRLRWGAGRVAGLLAFALLVGTSCTLAPLSDRHQVGRLGEAVLPMAQAALDAGQIEMARRLYGRLLDVVPESVEARMGLGRVALAARDADQAASWHLSALTYAATPEKRHAVLLAHGRAALAAGQHAEALRSFVRLAHPDEQAPAHLAAWGLNGIGVVRWLDGDPYGAVDAMEEAVLRDPSEPAFRNNMAAAVEMLATLDLGAAPDPDQPAARTPDVLAIVPQDPVPDVLNTVLPDRVPDVVRTAPPDPGIAVAMPHLREAAQPAPRDEEPVALPERRCSWWLFTWPCENPPADGEATDAVPAPPAVDASLVAETPTLVEETSPRGTVRVRETLSVSAAPLAGADDPAAVSVEERTENAEPAQSADEGMASYEDVVPTIGEKSPVVEEGDVPEAVAAEADAADGWEENEGEDAEAHEEWDAAVPEEEDAAPVDHRGSAADEDVAETFVQGGDDGEQPATEGDAAFARPIHEPVAEPGEEAGVHPDGDAETPAVEEGMAPVEEVVALPVEVEERTENAEPEQSADEGTASYEDVAPTIGEKSPVVEEGDVPEAVAAEADAADGWEENDGEDAEAREEWDAAVPEEEDAAPVDHRGSAADEDVAETFVRGGVDGEQPATEGDAAFARPIHEPVAERGEGAEVHPDGDAETPAVEEGVAPVEEVVALPVEEASWPSEPDVVEAAATPDAGVAVEDDTSDQADETAAGKEAPVWYGREPAHPEASGADEVEVASAVEEEERPATQEQERSGRVESMAHTLGERIGKIGGLFISASDGHHYVQLAALSERRAAEALADLVRKMVDFDVFAQGVDSSRGRLWRVRVGPVDTAAELALAVEQLEAGGYGTASAGAATVRAGTADGAAQVPAEEAVQVSAEEAGADGSAAVLVDGGETYVQVGTFAEWANALDLAVQLRELMMPTVKVVSFPRDDGSEIHRVRIGPLARDEAPRIVDLVREVWP